MQWFALILLCAAATISTAEPEPKKYKTEQKVIDKSKNSSLLETKLNIKEKNSSLAEKQSSGNQNSSLSDDEKKFLREVEEKYGIKPENPKINSDSDSQKSSTVDELPFPAIIAIEIVNDTDSKTKGKRTIDANLGYGYRTNNGYSYTYFGKQPQDKGKFMFYPYSQEDIPPPGKNYQKNTQSHSTIVDIKPSQAYELVPVKEEQNTYQPRESFTEHKNIYENVKGLESPPPSYPEIQYQSTQQNTPPSSTFYTTFNGKQFSGFTKQFPTVLPNYFVSQSQLLRSPQYQNAGLTQAYLPSHGSQVEQRVVPVLVLKVPSTYLKDPSAELYSDMPNNYLNNLNLQQLVHDYFKNIGYSHGPQLTAFLNSPAPAAVSTVSSPIGYEAQQYSDPYVIPSYTQSHFSGIQYSAVNPVMAKFPKTYNQQSYYTPRYQPRYQQPLHQNYEHQFKYIPQSTSELQKYYAQQQYQQQLQSSFPSLEHGRTLDVDANHQYVDAQQSNYLSPASSSVEYGSPPAQHLDYTSAQPEISHYEAAKSKYGSPNEDNSEYSTLSPEYANSGLSQEQQYEYASPKNTDNYYSEKQSAQFETFQSQPNESSAPSYQKQLDGSDNTLVISENYPSKDHTIATVLPYKYKPNTGTVQSVSYVTPVPSKYQSRYNVMVPQTVFKSPTEEKVSYVNSHSVPNYGQAGASNTDYNSQTDYSVESQYVPIVGTQKPSSFPRNYHAYSKRMTRPIKSESTASIINKTEKKTR